MSGTGANLPITISVAGAPQAEAAFNAVAASGSRAMTRVQQSADAAGTSTSRLGNVVGQAGFQLQDFATQVSMGQNALTAFATQGSQLLGIFGTGGAIAGAALTVGVLAASLLSAGDSGAEAGKKIEEAFKATVKQTEDLAELVRNVADLFLTVDQRATAAAERSRTSLLEQARAQMRFVSNEQTAAVSQMTQAEAELARLAQSRARLERDLANASPRNRDSIASDLREARDAEFAARARRDGARSELDRTTGLLGSLGGDVARLEALRYGPMQDQPPAPDRPGRGGGGGADRAREFLDANEALGRSLDELQGRLDTYNRAIGESESGLTGAAAATAEYEARLQTLRDAVDAGLISEEQFNTEVERTTAALDRQMAEIERRANRGSDVTRELGLSFSSAFEDAIVKGAELSDVLKGLEQDIARIIIRKAVTEPLNNAASDFAKSIATSIFSGAPGRAMGGPVTAGQPYWVGENGPEPFIPNASGTIIPNHALGGVNFSPVYNIDARGADPSMIPRLRAEMAQIAAASIADLENRVNRGGAASRTFGRR